MFFFKKIYVINLILILFFVFDDNKMIFDRENILNGMYWQLITGNLLHTNLYHFLLNIISFNIIYYMFSLKEQPNIFALIAIFCFFEGLCIFLFDKATMKYVGLSGVLHVLFAFGAIKMIKNKENLGVLFLILEFVKIGYEQINGANIKMVKLINANIAINAHMYGAIIGCLIGMIIFFGKIILKKH